VASGSSLCKGTGEGHLMKHKHFLLFGVNKKLGGGEAGPFLGQGICSLSILGKTLYPSIGELLPLP